MKLYRTLLLCMMVTICKIAPAQTLGTDTTQIINDLFKNWNDSTPGGVIIITRHGKSIYEKAFGLADMEHKIANTQSTVFEAGSVSKQFTAAAVLVLVDQGKLSLQDDVRKYIPELPDYGNTIKIVNLLNHTSGIKEWSSLAALSGWPRGTKAYTQGHVLDIITNQKSLNFKTASQYSYSNSNYVLLAQIVEKVSGQKFTDFTANTIFAPLGMTSTQWRDDFRKIVPGRAIAYGKTNKSYFLNMPFESNYGHGGLLTTANDLVKWNEAWENKKLGNSLAQLRLQKGILSDGTTIDYAGGVFVRDYNGKKEVSHSGTTAGYRSWLAYYPDLQLSFVYLSNDGSLDPESVGEKLKQIFLGAAVRSSARPLTVRTLPKEAFAGKAGAYKNQLKYEVLELEARDTGLFIKNGPMLKPLSLDTFILNESKYLFNKDQIINLSTSDVYEKMPGAVFSDSLYQAYAGNYYSEEAETEVRLEVKNGKLFFLQRPGLQLPLQPVYKDGFIIVAGEKILVEFERNKKGEVISFLVHMQRAKNIRFRRL